MRIAELMSIALPQHGCVTRQQCLQVMTIRQFDYLVTTQVLHRRHPSVYTVAGSPDSWLRRASAAVLSVPGSALSHRSAARLWGLDMQNQRIAISIPRHRVARRDGVSVYRHRIMHVTKINGIAVTTAERTIVDMARVVPASTAESLLDQALHQKLITLFSVDQCLTDIWTQRHRGMVKLQHCIWARNSNDEKLDSDLEKMVLGWIRTANIPEPIAQRPVVVNGTRYWPDISYPDHKIIIEPDGPHHLLPSVALRDRLRDADFQLDGWLVMRVPYDCDRDDFIPRLRTALARRGGQATAGNLVLA